MNDVILTLDMDWAPAWAIDWVAAELITYQVRATWFVTHESPALERLRKYPDLFELGIHPNFLAGSTHGDTSEAVLSHCMRLVPKATSMRTHALFQSTPLLDLVLAKTPITADVSLFLPMTAQLRPVPYQRMDRQLLRIPFFWEDDYEMGRPSPNWELAGYLNSGEGLKVFNFHVIHAYLNSTEMAPYHRLLRRTTRLSEATAEQATEFVHVGKGTGTLFREVLDYLRRTGGSIRIRDVQHAYDQHVGVR